MMDSKKPGPLDRVVVSLAAMSLLTYLAVSEGVHNHILFLIESARKILSMAG